MKEEKLRFSAVAGQFYPEEKRELERMIDGFLKEVKIPEIEGEVFGLILPHAGYVFSGFVAAHGFKLISEKNFKDVILIGDSHYEYFDGVSIWEKGFWETPLGKIRVNEELAKKILSYSKRFFIRDSAHLFEHSLEVQLPFLQKVLKDFEIVPIIFGSEDKDWKELAKAILNSMEKNTLVIASSDLSHYPPYEVAKKVDSETIEAILKCDPREFSKKMEELKENFPDVDTFACAQDSIKTILEISKQKKAKAKLLKYQNSGESIFGDKFQVVGYSAICFYV
jgi:AmmeMemoRadiSam system protein B